MKASQVLRIAVATVFAGGSALSFAAISTTAVKVSNSLPTNGVTLTAAGTGPGANELSFSSNTTSFAPSAGQSLQVNVTLDNGAKFGSAPLLRCQVSGVGATAGTAQGTLNLGGAGSNNAIFTVGQTEVSAVASGGSISACSVVVTSMTVTGAHVNNNASITYQYGTLASGVEAGPIINWVKGVSASITGSPSVVALVTGGFVTISGGVAGTANLVSGGTVSFRGATSANSATLGSQQDVGTVISTASITVAGLPLGAAVTTGGVWIVTAADTCSGGTRLASATGGLASVTFSGLTSAQVSGGVNVCVGFNGTSAIPEGNITASLTVGLQTGFTADTSTASNVVATVTRNGSSTRAMNIPAVTNTDQAFIRVTNTSAISGKLYGTLYSQDGVVLGTANAQLADAATFTPNKTLVFDAATIKSTLGVSADWTGRAQLVLTAETTAIRAQNLIRVANGTLVNVGGDTSGAGN